MVKRKRQYIQSAFVVSRDEWISALKKLETAEAGTVEAAAIQIATFEAALLRANDITLGKSLKNLDRALDSFHRNILGPAIKENFSTRRGAGFFYHQADIVDKLLAWAE
ncbi:MAG: hypothetical protein AAFN93_29120 [Bacteroidota bacterium]